MLIRECILAMWENLIWRYEALTYSDALQIGVPEWPALYRKSIATALCGQI